MVGLRSRDGVLCACAPRRLPLLRFACRLWPWLNDSFSGGLMNQRVRCSHQQSGRNWESTSWSFDSSLIGSDVMPLLRGITEVRSHPPATVTPQRHTEPSTQPLRTDHTSPPSPAPLQPSIAHPSPLASPQPALKHRQNGCYVHHRRPPGRIARCTFDPRTPMRKVRCHAPQHSLGPRPTSGLVARGFWSCGKLQC